MTVTEVISGAVFSTVAVAVAVVDAPWASVMVAVQERTAAGWTVAGSRARAASLPSVVPVASVQA